jgi:glycosyl transferase family 25
VKALVINLDRDTARMAFQARQLGALGIGFARLPAITPDALDPPPDNPYWGRWQRPLRPAEMALTASHGVAWRAIAAGADPVLVLEDDALLAPGLAGLLDQVATLPQIDYLNLETRARKKLVARVPHLAAPIRRLWQDRCGSAAYALWPDGARALLRRLARAPGPSDAVLSAAYDLRAWQADPALAIQIDQCGRYGLTPPIPVASAILATERPATRSPAQRARRIGAQLRMGLRQLARAPGAKRVEIWPALQPADGAA